MLRIWQSGWWWLIFAVACARDGSTDVVRVQLRGSLPLSAADVRYAPAGAVKSARLGASGVLAIERLADRALRVEVPGFCPLLIARGPQQAELQLTPVIDLGGDRPPLGFDARFAIAVKHGCPDIGRGSISWRQVSGPRLRELIIEDAGFRLSARTASLSELQPAPLPKGIVPFSPRTQGRVVLEARWQRGAEPAIVQTLSISATSRATGLSSVAVSQQLVLGDGSYRVKSAPLGGHATALAHGDVSLFTPDAHGRWVLERAGGETLTLQALWHDKTPYDCGRSECHAQIASSTEPSAMSHALERRMPVTAAVSCMLDCHVTGERGLRDGGFLAVASELGFEWVVGRRWEELPQALRRLGGVRCTACHGPGAIPEPEGRSAILRADVCATCHDAPPAYPQVSAWRATRMAHADGTPATREGACAGCHTTAGFLAELGARKAAPPPPTAASDGIACAACHAPHAQARGPRLLRAAHGAGPAAGLPDAPTSDPATQLCLACHRPRSDALQPTAAAGPLWSGVARVPAANGQGFEELHGPAAHANVPRGCIGCHGAQPTAAGKLDHSFRVDRAVCSSCHTARLTLDNELLDRAQRLVRALSPYCSSGPLQPAEPPHAAPASHCDTPRKTRARYLASLVLEDPAAGVHNAAFARALLQDAELQLTAAEPGSQIE